MAIGDVVGSIVGVTAGASLTVRPTGAATWLITTIAGEDWGGTTPNKAPNVILYLSDGTNDVMFFSNDAQAIWPLKQKIFVSNSYYLKIKNPAASSKAIGWNGIIWKD